MLENRCIIGVDAGTSVVKAVAFDYTGREICAHEIPVELLQHHPAWVEQDMNGLWENVKTCVAAVSHKLKVSGRTAAGIGLTSTGDGTWLMDADGRPVRGGILWCDGRTAKIVGQWHSSDVARRAFEICGTSVFTGSQAAQLAWLRDNEPDSLRRATVIFHAKDWLFYKMTDVVSSDETDESLTMLRMSTRQYDPELFRIFGIEDLFPKFPEVRPTVQNVAPISPSVAGELGLDRETMVGSGPMDVAACALGTGAIEHGQACSILGTAGIHQVIMAEPNLAPSMVGMTLCHGIAGRWMRMLAAMTATPNLDWFLKELGGSITSGLNGRSGDLYTRLESVVESVPAGSEGVMFHPYLFPGGERGPFVRPTARASFTGLNLNHSARHLLRSVYEGVAFATLDCYRHMPIEPETVFLSGGGSNSPAWRQIIADCLGKPVVVPEGSQFGAKGAALNLGIATGVYAGPRDAVEKTVRAARCVEPVPANSKIYAELYEVYRKTAERQMDLWDLRAKIISKES